MSDVPFHRRIARTPRPVDADALTEAGAALSATAPAFRTLAARAASAAPYLAELLRHHPDWALRVSDGVPEASLASLCAEVAAVPAQALGAGLRGLKARMALLVALADLGGVWDLDAVTAALSQFADAALARALDAALREEIRRGRLPGLTDEDEAAGGAGMVILAMGKLGAGELNYSSDIDLIALFDETRFAGAEAEARAAFIRVMRRVTALLGDVTAEGYVFRVDLRLRPDASVTPVCLSMAAAEAYYEAEGRTWERAAYIKARPSAGDLAAGARFLKTLTPFVWRKHLDFAAIEDAHAMRLRIRDHRHLHGPARIEGHDIKLGQGGIREIEFFAQTRQLIAGGRDPGLRDPTTCGALAALAERRWIPRDVAATLTADYGAHRMLEHRLQMVRDAHTHEMPATRDGVARIAALSDMDEAAFRAELAERIARVETLTGAFFSGPAAETAGNTAPASRDEARIVDGWLAYPALRSERARQIFTRVAPALLARLDHAADRGEALRALDGFLSGLPAGVQVFSLFAQNPVLVDLIVDIAGTAPALARHLARNPGVLDAVIGGSFFEPWPGVAALTARIGAAMADAGDYEAALDACRRLTHEMQFRIGVHHLRGLVEGAEAGAHYADLAEAVLAALFPVVGAEIARRHGAAPGKGAVVLGMGSLGAGRLNARSDLDLIVIYDAPGDALSDGPRPLAARSYYARLTQTLVTALSAPTAEGRLYEVDMRLRPSGRQGPVATGWEAFTAYQETEAWTWEHLALTRARAVAGSAALGARVEAFRRALIVRKGREAKVAPDTQAMRVRLFDARPGDGGLDARNGAGRLLDLDLFAQYLALRSGSAARTTRGQLAAGSASVLSQTEATTLAEAAELYWNAHAATRLLSEDRLELSRLGKGGQAFLMNATRTEATGDLPARLAAAAVSVAAVIDRHLGTAGA